VCQVDPAGLVATLHDHHPHFVHSRQTPKRLQTLLIHHNHHHRYEKEQAV
jgi:hypothetical protein